MTEGGSWVLTILGGQTQEQGHREKKHTQDSELETFLTPCGGEDLGDTAGGSFNWESPHGGLLGAQAH